MGVEILIGDVAETVAGFVADRFDAVLCDPPYGIRFMGRRWDYDVPRAATWEAVLRVCKPGAPLIAFGATRAWHRTAVQIEDAGFIPDDTLMWLFGQGKPASKNRLKPAWEPAMLFRKWFDGTTEESAEKWGAGLLAIDACRIDAGERRHLVCKNERGNGVLKGNMHGSVDLGMTTKGRWPANLILDEEAAAALDMQAGVRTTHGGNVEKRHASMGYGGGAGSERALFSSSGGASRFFYTAKVKGGEEAEGNEHPTKKPVKLTTYLARLIRPERPGALLVPFCGSGSEIIGALRAGWTEIVAIDNDPDAVAFARERCAAEESGTTLRASRAGQPGLFGGTQK